MNNLTIVNNIKKLCQEHNISVSQLEKDLYMSPGLISRWNKNMPTLDRVVDIADYFGVPLDAIAGNNQENNHATRTINLLISALYQKTISAEIDWLIFNSKSPINTLSENILSSFNTGSNQHTFFCPYNDGYFFFTVNYNAPEPEEYELCLYVLANKNAFPEARCSDTAKLRALYEYLNRKFAKSLNTMLTDNFIDDFLNSSPLSESILVSRNNIAVLNTSVNAVNQ